MNRHKDNLLLTWKRVEPLYISNIMQPILQTSQGKDQPSSKRKNKEIKISTSLRNIVNSRMQISNSINQGGHVKMASSSSPLSSNFYITISVMFLTSGDGHSLVVWVPTLSVLLPSYPRQLLEHDSVA